MRDQPFVVKWRAVDDVDENGEVHRAMALVPTRRYARAAASEFGEPDSEHVIVVYEERNMKFHNKCFAALHDAWVNLPETTSARFPTEEHFRKWLLANKSDFFDEIERDFPKLEEARAYGIGVRAGSPYATIKGPFRTAGGWKMIVRRPRSQKLSKMSPRDFEESMTQILDAAGEFVGVKRGELLKNAGRAA